LRIDPVEPPDPARVREGWERRFIVEARRVPEYAELYEGLGYEVCADPAVVHPAIEACADCRLAQFLEFKTIYTRKKL
jgi:hypothetical protein